MNREREAWIGLVHLKPIRVPNILGPGHKGAYVNVVALATDAAQFHASVENAVRRDGLYVVETDDVEPVRVYRRDGRMNEEIEGLIDTLSDLRPIQFDIFDVYTEDDA